MLKVAQRQIAVSHCPSLKITVDDGDELIGGVDVERPWILFRIDQVRADVVLDHLGQETVDGAAAAGNEVHDLLAPFLLLERAHDRVGLAADTARPIEEFLLFANGVAHTISQQ